MRRSYSFVSLLVLAAVAVTAAQAGWGAHGHDPGATRFSPLTQITPENVSQLKLVWTYDTLPDESTPSSAFSAGRDAAAGAPGAPAGRGAGAAQGRGAGANAAAGAGQGDDASGGPARARQSAATPLVVGDVMYLSTAYNNVVALDAETGKEIWVVDVGHSIATRGIAYWQGMADIAPRLVFGTNDGFLVELDARTGAFARGFGEDGLVNMRAGVADKFPNARGGIGLSSPPVIYKQVVITGAHSQEAPSLGPSGDLRGWDIRTGQLLWTFHTVPRPGEKGHEVWQADQWVDRAGANTWGLMTLDEDRGIVYAPTGTPPTDFYGADRLGQNLYGSSLLAVDAMTGTLKWYFQTTHHDNWDYDLTSPPALIEVNRNGQTIPAVAQYSKQGLLFIFNRVTGEPIFGVEERKVLSDNPLPGDEYWPTQPFPIKPAPLARMTFSREEVATVTPEHEKYCRDLLDLEGGAMTGGPYAQYGPKLRVIFPGWTGGGNWNGGAYFPDLGYYVIPSQDLGMLNKMVKSPTNPNMYVRRGPDNAPTGLGTNFWDGVKGWPCQQPPWGELIAVNVNTGDIAWRRPLGSFEELDQKHVPETGTPIRGGPIVTASGVVFIAASQDAKFRAFDVRTGQVLWTAELTENGRTVPITYEGKSGKQYVAILAGGGNPVGRKVDVSQIGGRLHVYALPDAGARADAAPVARRIGAPGVGAEATSASTAAPSNRIGVPAVAAAAAPAAARARPAGARPARVLTDFSKVFPPGKERDLVGTLCTQCHDLEISLGIRLSKTRWQAVLNDMAGRGAEMDDQEYAQVVDYLARNYGPN